MPIYKAPLKDFDFILNEFLDIDANIDVAGFADAKELATPLLDEGAKFCENVLFIVNKEFY